MEPAQTTCVRTARVEGVARSERATGITWRLSRIELFDLMTATRQASGIYPHAGGTYMDPPALSRGSRVKQHASGQMQSYIRPLGEDLLGSSGPDAICASSPNHDRGLKGPVPTQVGRKPVER